MSEGTKARVNGARLAETTHEGVDLTADAADAHTAISWHLPHVMFVIILVGEDEIPFGIQKDLLVAKSPYYRTQFSNSESLEQIVDLPEFDVATFGCVQNFLFTGEVYDKENGVAIPDYSQLLSVWKLATKMDMAPLRVAVLDVMAERREQTAEMPDTPLLMQAWEDTKDGSGLRLMLVRWAAEHMRTSAETRAEFAKSLPHEILTDLCVAMAEIHTPTQSRPVTNKRLFSQIPGEVRIDDARPVSKKARKLDTGPLPNGQTHSADDVTEVKSNIKHVKKPVRKSEPLSKANRRIVKHGGSEVSLSPAQELDLCRDMLHRMVTGPGYWTRLVGPFKHPVDPVAEQIPNYYSVVKRPMDLSTMKTKMDKGEYGSAEEFESDIRQIFQNCFDYWTPNDKVFQQCQQFEDYFNKQWAERHKPGKGIKAENE